MTLPLYAKRVVLSNSSSQTLITAPLPYIHHHPQPHNSSLVVLRAYSSHHQAHHRAHPQTHPHAQPRTAIKSTKSHLRSPSSAQSTSPQVSTSATLPSTASTSSTTLVDDINPPPSTLPAALLVPDALEPNAPAASKLKRYVALGRAYLTFYKTGLKNVYHNYRACIPLRRELGLSTYLPTSPVRAFLPRVINNKPRLEQGTSTAANGNEGKGPSPNISRAAFQLLHRSAHDIRRMIPFSLILVICGEMTPLAVLVLGNSVTPYTCRVPGQIEKDRNNRAKAKREALDVIQADKKEINPPSAGSNEEMDLLLDSLFPTVVGKNGYPGVKRDLESCAILGLAKTHRGLLRSTILNGLLGLYGRRLRHYVEYLDVDDELIRRCGGVKGMEGAEVRIAVEERGGLGVADGLDGWEAERVERRWLERWLERRRSI